MFDFSNTLLLFVSLLTFMLSVVGGHLGFLDRGCRQDTSVTSWQTSVSRPARRSQTSVCLEMATPRMGQDRACSILSHRHSLGSPGGGELYLTQSAFERAPLCRVNPCLTIGSAVSQL